MKYSLDYNSKLNIYFLCLFSFFLPLWQKLSTIILILWFLASVINYKKFQINKKTIPLILLYISYFFFDQIHFADGFKVLEMKASLLVLPLIFSFNQFNFRDIRKGYLFFVYGCLFAIFLCYIYAIYRSISYSNGALIFNSIHVSTDSEGGFLNSSVFGGNYFFGKQFSVFHQTVYFSIYLNLTLIIVLFTKIFNSRIKYLLVLILSVTLFQISNMTNIFLFAIILVIYFFFFINDFYKRTTVLFVGLSILIAIVLVNPRINNTLRNIYLKGINLDREAEDSMGTRLLIWDASIDIAQKHFFAGVGSSNTYDTLKVEYKKKRYITPYKYRLNSHNQFLQIIIECGLVGFFLLFTLLVILSKQKFNKIALIVTFLFVINFTFESVLNRYSGIVIFTFIYCMLTNKIHKQYN